MSTAAPGLLSAAEVSALRHDLRTPVNHIVGYCELLLEDAEAAGHASRRAALADALAAVREALGTIESGLPSSGERVTRPAVESLYRQLEGPRDRIISAATALAATATAGSDPEFEADVRRIAEAARRLAAPASPGAAGAAPVAPAPRPASPGSAPVRGARILVVDDVAENRDVLRRHLARQGHEVTEAPDGPTALARLAAASFDLVLLDMQMPGMDGFQVLERIKSQPATRDVPVVMVSASDDLGTIAACIEAGAEDYLPKPFDPVVLRARVSASAEKKRLRNLEVDYLHQVDRVVGAAGQVEQGTYVAGSLSEVARRDDAIGHLARVFDGMAAGIRAREERLRGQVNDLRREIDAAARGTPASAAEDTEAGLLIPGESFAERYQVLRLVGRGGMGTVYKAADRELGEEIAIKLIRADVLQGDPTMAERFRSEIRLARRISHRNVVRTHDFGEWDGRAYVTMEYVEGITVRDLIDARRTLSPSSALGLARQLAEALAVAHEQGVIHRDIKPQNLLLDAAGVLKIMDFGIARMAEGVSSITQTGMVVGTPAYMAPEQLLDEAVDARGDLYATGVVLYECLTGRLPYTATSPIALIAKVLNGAPAAPVESNPEIPPALSALVLRLMARSPDDRPASARELSELLSRIG